MIDFVFSIRVSGIACSAGVNLEVFRAVFNPPPFFLVEFFGSMFSFDAVIVDYLDFVSKNQIDVFCY